MKLRFIFALIACSGLALAGCPGAPKKAPVEEEAAEPEAPAKKADDDSDDDSADEGKKEAKKDDDDDSPKGDKEEGDKADDGAEGNDKVAKLRKGCDEGKAAACNDLGFAYDKGNDGVEEDKKKALGLYKKACKAGNRFGCNNTGIFLERGFAGDIDLAAALPKYEKACDLGHAWGCTNAARMHYKGLGGKKDAAKGYNYWELGCKKNNATACNNIAWHKCKDDKKCGDEEEKLARRAVASSPKSASYHDTLAYVLCERNKKGEANKAFAKACELGYKEDCDVKCDKKTRARKVKRKTATKWRRTGPSWSDVHRAKEKQNGR